MSYTREDQPCPICLDSINGSDMPITTLKCKHQYHFDCISTSLATKKSCPMCRAIVNIKEKPMKVEPEESDIKTSELDKLRTKMLDAYYKEQKRMQQECQSIVSKYWQDYNDRYKEKNNMID